MTNPMVPTPRMPGAGSAEAAYRGQAMQQLRILKQQMQISGLKQAERRVNLGDGVELVCSISFNDERAYVRVPRAGGVEDIPICIDRGGVELDISGCPAWLRSYATIKKNKPTPLKVDEPPYGQPTWSAPLLLKSKPYTLYVYYYLGPLAAAVAVFPRVGGFCAYPVDVYFSDGVALPTLPADPPPETVVYSDPATDPTKSAAIGTVLTFAVPYGSQDYDYAEQYWENGAWRYPFLGDVYTGVWNVPAGSMGESSWEDSTVNVVVAPDVTYSKLVLEATGLYQSGDVYLAVDYKMYKPNDTVPSAGGTKLVRLQGTLSGENLSFFFN